MPTDEELLKEAEADIESQPKAGADDGTGSNQPAADSSNPDGQPVEDSPEALKAALEAERKERQKIEMERNQLKNKQKEAELKSLEDQEKYKEAYETLKAETEQRQQEEEERRAYEDAVKLRDSLIAQRPETVQRAAKALIDKNPNNLAWSDANDADEAAAQLNTQLDALQTALGVQPSDPAPDVNVHPNNPGAPMADKPFEAMSLDEMEAELPWAPPR